LEGCEGIEFADERSIVGLGNYAATPDVEHFRTPSKGAATVRNLPGRFVIILPGDPHLPQLALDEGASPLVRKLVVKVPAALVGVPEITPTWAIQPLEGSAK
jgi:beta-galactosidase beta subunit